MKLKPGAVITEPGSSQRYETGGWRTFRPIVDEAKCTGCGICWMFCPEAAITRGKPAKVDLRYCKGCGICSNECPVKAITLKAEGKK